MTDPFLWYSDISAIYYGRCYTLQYPEKVGSHLDTNIMLIFLNENLSYDVFIHDPKYYLASIMPSAFPHIRYLKFGKEIFKIHFYFCHCRLKKKPNMPMEDSKNLDLLYISETRHKKLNREEFKCAEDDNYNWRQCIKTSVVKKIGCRMEWDKLESIQNVPLCDNLQKMRYFKKKSKNSL